uniref:Uncharacterized protein n=1 Tax=Anguilla anguilla TaxID=7936 RepID=A0A0E9QTG6_ANGAN
MQNTGFTNSYLHYKDQEEGTIKR